MLKKKLEELKATLKETFKDGDIIVDDVTFEKKGGYKFLTVILDKVGGIDLDAIVSATNVVNKIVDEANITDESYILDVVSKERGDKNE